MSIVSNILRRDIDTIIVCLAPGQLASLIGGETSQWTLAIAGDGDGFATAKTNIAGVVNKRISDACSTPESVELCAELGKAKGTLAVTSLSARGEREQSKVDGKKYTSPAWVWACKVNKLAAALRRGLDVE